MHSIRHSLGSEINARYLNLPSLCALYCVVYMCHLHMLSNSAIKVGVQAAPVKDAGRVKFGLQALVNGIKRACL